jgi:hypothetical protein
MAKQNRRTSQLQILTPGHSTLSATQLLCTGISLTAPTGNGRLPALGVGPARPAPLVPRHWPGSRGCVVVLVVAVHQSLLGLPGGRPRLRFGGAAGRLADIAHPFSAGATAVEGTVPSSAASRRPRRACVSSSACSRTNSRSISPASVSTARPPSLGRSSSLRVVLAIFADIGNFQCKCPTQNRIGRIRHVPVV